MLDRRFPSRSELGEIAAAPAPLAQKALEGAPVAVETWELEGPFPEHAGSERYEGEEPESRALRQSSAVATTSMRCFARELGRFLGAHERRPQVDLQAFMAGRCGVLTTHPQFSYLVGQSPLSDGEIKELVGQVSARLPRGAEVGAWVGKAEKSHVAVVVFGAPKVKLESVGLVENGTLRLRGRLLERTGWMHAHVNQGPFGAERCEPSPKSPALPAFDLLCPVDTTDAFTVVGLLAGAPDAVLGQFALTLVVPLTDTELKSYASARSTTAGPSAREGLIAEINAARAKVSEVRLQEVKAQSKTAAALLPHFFAAAGKSDQELMDKITLGMLAGWDVKGPIRSAGFVSFYGNQGNDAHNFVNELLFFPSYRALLLDPDARKVALALENNPATKADFGMLTAYALFEPRDESKTEQAILDELDRQRSDLGKSPVERVSDPNAVVTSVLKKLEHGEIDPMTGLTDVLDTYVKRTHRNFQGLVFSTTVIDGFRPEFPPSLLEFEHVAALARVGFYVGEGSNWGQYAVYVIFMPVD